MQTDRLFVCIYISEMEMLLLMLMSQEVSSLQRTESGESHLYLVKAPRYASIIDTPCLWANSSPSAQPGTLGP